jgi:Tol biopolymer transport system component
VVLEGTLDSDPRGQRRLYAIDLSDGGIQLLAGGPDAEIAHRWGGRHFWSPDGKVLILERPENRPGLLVADRETGAETLLPMGAEATEVRFQAWAPDGRSFFYVEWQREYDEPQGAFPPPTKEGEEPPERTRLRTSRPMLYLWDHDEGSSRLLSANALGAASSPDGESVAFMLLGNPERGPEGELVGTDLDPGQPFELYLAILDLKADRLEALVSAGHVAFDWDPLTAKAAPMAVDRLGGDSYRPTWSPDGGMLLYLDSMQDLWACSADGQARARVTTGGWGVDEAAWSADGAYVALTTSVRGIQGDPLWVIRRPVLPQVTGPSPTGTPAATPGPGTEVRPTPAAAVRVAEITELSTPNDGCYPLLSPSGPRYLCYRTGEDEQPELWLASLDEGLLRPLVRGQQIQFAWVDENAIVYAPLPTPETGPLVPVTFLDLETSEAQELGRTYEITRILAHPTGYVAFASDQGVHVANPRLGTSTVVPIQLGQEAWCGLYRGATPQPLSTPPPWSEAYSYVGLRFALSPDGSKLATLRLREECAVLSILDVATGTETIISDGLSYEPFVFAPQAPLAWSPDGSTLAYSLDRPETRTWEIWLVNADGSGARSLWAPGEWKHRYDYLTWLGEGPYLAFVDVPGGTDGMLHAALRAIDTRGGQPMTLAEEIHEVVQISPDGRRVVYTVGSFQMPTADWRHYLARLEW